MKAEYGYQQIEALEVAKRVGETFPELVEFMSAYDYYDQLSISTAVLSPDIRQGMGKKERVFSERGLRLIPNNEYKAAIILAETEQYYRTIDDAVIRLLPKSKDEDQLKAIRLLHATCSSIVSATLQKDVKGIGGVEGISDIEHELSALGIDKDQFFSECYGFVTECFSIRGFENLAGQASSIQHTKRWEGSISQYATKKPEPKSFPLSDDRIRELDHLSGRYVNYKTDLKDKWTAVVFDPRAPITPEFIGLHPDVQARDGLLLHKYPEYAFTLRRSSKELAQRIANLYPPTKTADGTLLHPSVLGSGEVQASVLEEILDDDVRSLLFGAARYPISKGIEEMAGGYRSLKVAEIIPKAYGISEAKQAAYSKVSELLVSQVYLITAEVLRAWGGKLGENGNAAFEKHTEIEKLANT